MSIKIRMMRTEKGSPNGIDVITYQRGREYILPDDLANTLINLKAAILSVETKMEAIAPYNKMMDHSKVENKATEEVIKSTTEVRKRRPYKRRG